LTISAPVSTLRHLVSFWLHISRLAAVASAGGEFFPLLAETRQLFSACLDFLSTVRRGFVALRLMKTKQERDSSQSASKLSPEH
jgi:hypothetical protein